MQQAGGQGGQLPPQILADQKAPPGGGGTPPHATLLPAPRIFDPCNTPDLWNKFDEKAQCEYVFKILKYVESTEYLLKSMKANNW